MPQLYWLQFIGALAQHREWIQVLGDPPCQLTEPISNSLAGIKRNGKPMVPYEDKLLHGTLATWKWNPATTPELGTPLQGIDPQDPLRVMRAQPHATWIQPNAWISHKSWEEKPAPTKASDVITKKTKCCTYHEVYTAEPEHRALNRGGADLLKPVTARSTPIPTPLGCNSE